MSYPLVTSLGRTRRDPVSGTAPLLHLDGLARVRRWVNALDPLDATGDYRMFTPRLIEDGLAAAGRLPIGSASQGPPVFDTA